MRRYKTNGGFRISMTETEYAQLKENASVGLFLAVGALCFVAGAMVSFYVF